MNIFTGKEHDGKTRIYIECDIHKLTKTTYTKIIKVGANTSVS